MPASVSKEKQDELFLEFIDVVTSRTKLIESNFYVVTDKDYTGRYREILNKNRRYKGSYINDIKEIYINPAKTEICKMLQ